MTIYAHRLCNKPHNRNKHCIIVAMSIVLILVTTDDEMEKQTTEIAVEVSTTTWLQNWLIV